MSDREDITRVREDVDALVDVGGRVAGSDAERRAARHAAGRLDAMGREADVEAISVFPSWHLAHVAHALLGILGSVVAVESPALGAAFAGLAVLSAALDATGVAHFARRLTGRRASQNVVSREDGDKPGTLVLLAHLDTARSGAAFNRRVEERRATLGRLLRRPLSPLGPLFWSLVVIFACAVLRIVGLEGTLLTAVQFVPTAVLIVHLPLLVDIALSEPVPGANDNASGVAAVLELADLHGGKLEHFDLWVVLTGAQESGALGMREFLRRHRGELDRGRTVFVNLDELGAGTVRFSRREGLLLTTRSHPQLVALCKELAEDDSEAGARPISIRSPTDAAAARAAGYPAITLTSRNALDYVPGHHTDDDTPGRLEDGALERSLRFAHELVERIDQALGPELRR